MARFNLGDISKINAKRGIQIVVYLKCLLTFKELMLSNCGAEEDS